MPPQIVLIRHAQALHNVEKEYSLHDPKLTPLGESQCQPLRDSLLRRFGHVPARDIAVIVSPMLRTLQTASLALDWLVERGVKFEASADWQETSSQPCDTGSQSPTTLLPPSFPHVLFDLDPIWPDKTSPSAHRYHPTRRAVVERGRLCLESLHQRPEKLVFVVLHSGFLRAGVTGRWFMNADYRVFEFQDGLEDGRRLIRQDESTSEGGLGLSLAETVPLGHHLPEEHVQEHAS